VRKELGLMLMGAVCFDLGVLVIPARAADVDYYMKIDNMHTVSFNFVKIEIDYAAAAKACTGAGGTPVDFKGTKYCRTQKADVRSNPSTQKK